MTENYNNVKEENITGPLTQTVTNATTNHYQGTLTEDVGGAWTVDPVKGDIFFNTTGNFKVTLAAAMQLTANGGNIEITDAIRSRRRVSGIPSGLRPAS